MTREEMIRILIARDITWVEDELQNNKPNFLLEILRGEETDYSSRYSGWSWLQLEQELCAWLEGDVNSPWDVTLSNVLSLIEHEQHNWNRFIHWYNTIEHLL